MAEERFDLDRLSSLLSQHQKTVSGWLEQDSGTATNTKKKSGNIFPSSNVDLNVARPPRLGIGAKPGNQKAQLSDSIFISQQLRMRMTGQEKLGNINQVNLKAIGKPSKKEEAPIKKAESDDEGRSRTLAVKAPPPPSKRGKKKQRKK